MAKLPLPIESAEQVVEAIFAAATDRTRLLVVSHITSPTAVTLPVEPIVAEAKRRGILVASTVPMRSPNCRWSWIVWAAISIVPAVTNGSRSFGSGFLYVSPNTTPRFGRRSSVGALDICTVGCRVAGRDLPTHGQAASSVHLLATVLTIAANNSKNFLARATAAALGLPVRSPPWIAALTPAP